MDTDNSVVIAGGGKGIGGGGRGYKGDKWQWKKYNKNKLLNKEIENLNSSKT